MEKIFDKEVQDYLTSFGISEKEIYRVKFETLKAFVISKLKAVAYLIEIDHYDKIEEHLDKSPAGDGYGCDNHFIDFSGCIDYESLDIKQVCEQLRVFKQLSQ